MVQNETSGQDDKNKDVPQGKNFIDYNKNAKDFLEKLGPGKLGFNQVRLVGGTAPNRAHFCGAVVWRKSMRNGKTVVEFLAIPYNQHTHRSQKPNLKVISKEPHEDPYTTLIRELRQETGLSLTGEARVMLTTEGEDIVPPRPDENNPGKDHRRYWYLIEDRDCSGELLTSDVNPMDPETGKPMWLTAEELDEILYFGHRWPLYCAIEQLCLKAYDLWNLLDGKFRKPVDPRTQSML